MQAAPSRARGFDTDAPLTAETAAAFVARGFQFAMRYLARDAAESAAPGDLSAAEATLILQAGLALMPVQHVAAAGWVPDAELGSQYGAHAAANARAVGFPDGVSVWLDLEGIRDGTAADEVVAYCNAWYDTVAGAGFLPGLYVGAGAVLDGTALYERLRFQRYWQSGSRVPDVAQRGYCMVQSTRSQALDGVTCDVDFILADNEGDTPCWLAPLDGPSIPAIGPAAPAPQS